MWWRTSVSSHQGTTVRGVVDMTTIEAHEGTVENIPKDDPVSSPLDASSRDRQEEAIAPNPNHIFMLQVQIQTLHRQMEEYFSRPATASADLVREMDGFESRIHGKFMESNTALRQDVEAELVSFQQQIKNVQTKQSRDMEEIRLWVGEELQLMQRTMDQFFREETNRNQHVDRAIKQKNQWNYDESSKKYTRLETRLSDIEGAVGQIDELRRQVATQQKLLQSCQRHIRELQRDRDIYKEELALVTQESSSYNNTAGVSNKRAKDVVQYQAVATPTPTPTAANALAAKIKLSEKRQQALKFRETLNHLKFMSDGKKQEEPMIFDTFHPAEKRDPSH